MNCIINAEVMNTWAASGLDGYHGGAWSNVCRMPLLVARHLDYFS